jgi:hypothetical protein
VSDPMAEKEYPRPAAEQLLAKRKPTPDRRRLGRWLEPIVVRPLSSKEWRDLGPTKDERNRAAAPLLAKAAIRRALPRARRRGCGVTCGVGIR